MTIVALKPTLDVVGARMGMMFAILGRGLLVDDLVAGVILNSTCRYLGLEALCASAVTLCVIGLLLARLAKAGVELGVKV